MSDDEYDRRLRDLIAYIGQSHLQVEALAADGGTSLLNVSITLRAPTPRTHSENLEMTG